MEVNVKGLALREGEPYVKGCGNLCIKMHNSLSLNIMVDPCIIHIRSMM